jgi:dTDP-glucose 4,6-dehydratase
MKIVYVTGCLGFMGSYVTRACLKKGWYVRGVDKLTYASNEDLLKEFKRYKNFAFEQKDINDLNWLYDCDYIINTAAETHVDNSIVQSEEFVHSNINGVHNLLELIKTKNRFKMPIFLHFSTDEVYGDIIEGKHKETDLLKPSNPYSATKAAADQLILAWNRTYGIPYVIVRPTNNYGIGQYVEKLIPKTCKFVSLGRKIPLHDKGTPIRVWLHAKDTASAIIRIIETGSVNEIYNVAGSYEQENIETVKKILNLYFEGKEINYEKYIDFTSERVGQDLRYSIDDSKLQSIGWHPEHNFDSELPEIVQHYKDNFVW